MTPEAFVDILTETLGSEPNPEQRECLLHGKDAPTFIVAGPGSGKTRVLVQRAFRHAVVDRIFPEQIVVTTFTKKAAKEIRSRLIQWGEPVVEQARTFAEREGDEELFAYLGRVDVNRFVTGTLDGLCEEALDISRIPTEPRYTLLDEFAARTLLTRHGKLYAERDATSELDQFLSGFTLDGEPPSSTGDAARVLKSIADRIVHDLVDENGLQNQTNPGLRAALAVIQRYSVYLDETSQLDFPRLESTIWRRLLDGQDIGPLGKAQAVLVDEYQDTNLLQEQIYFGIAKRQAATLTVVGDDDQSLYRFRGATIELFRGFAERARTALSCGDISPIHLQRNYRSSKDIVDFFNGFIKNDPDFNPGARVQPLKPEITCESDIEPFPILGIFREEVKDLAEAVADFLYDIFSGQGRAIPDTDLKLRAAPSGGDFGDAVLLSKSVNEFGRAAFGKPPNPKFPYFLRNALEERGIRVFNPRGRPLRDVPAVQRLLGLVLETIDPSGPSTPDGTIASSPDMHLRNDVKRVFGEWRQTARDQLQANPSAMDGTRLQLRLNEIRKIAQPGDDSPRDWPLLDAVYAYVPYIPELSDDPEHQVYLEVVSRAASQMVSFSTYRGQIYRTEPHNNRSRRSALYDMLAPLAEGNIEIDEEILADVPRNCFNMMTIHQAKGLEFPMVIVDVSSECKTNHVKQRFKRFPERPSGTTAIEDTLAPFTEIGDLRLQRTPLQRSFEDIIREYYVAYSWPQSVLVLVGNRKAIRTNTNTKHVGHFWRSDGSWAWTDNLPARKPPPIPNLPFVLM
ncbi:UvrD-helicase domain-containing protein [Candidatus Thiosymbion oneisti]|uniref:UvrD-helicase domain-containing protein n=1 Tax=Candidatus Thiosymbion oneisti TaxID=589554 RepID=UPI000AB52A94|nr:UvrD-helicase domain-containing protein [Candidatus Thiosymbion oneisti]